MILPPFCNKETAASSSHCFNLIQLQVTKTHHLMQVKRSKRFCFCAQFKYYRHLRYLLIDCNYTVLLPELYLEIPMIKIDTVREDLNPLYGSLNYIILLLLRESENVLNFCKKPKSGRIWGTLLITRYVCSKVKVIVQDELYSLVHTLLYLLILSATATVSYREFMHKLVKLSNKLKELDVLRLNALSYWSQNVHIMDS